MKKAQQSHVCLTMWFSGQSGAGVRTWSGGHGYGVHDRSWGAFCEGEGEVFRVLGCRQEEISLFKMSLNYDKCCF